MIPLHPHLQNHVHGSGYRVKGLRPLRGLGQSPKGFTAPRSFWQYFDSMEAFFSSHPISRKGDGTMSEQEQTYWQRFLQTGQVEDYLRYRKYLAEQAENPRRRIEEASRYKNFY